MPNTITRPQWVKSHDTWIAWWKGQFMISFLWSAIFFTALNQWFECLDFISMLHGFDQFCASINSLWPNDAICRHRSGSILAQVMACCLTAPSHYLNQCWLIISKVQWHSSKGNFTRETFIINLWNQLKITYLKFHSNPIRANEFIRHIMHVGPITGVSYVAYFIPGLTCVIYHDYNNRHHATSYEYNNSLYL